MAKDGYEKTGMKVAFINREKTFTVNISGLLPLTYHYVYLEDNKVAADKLKPFGGDFGDLLKSKADGSLKFDFLYDTGLPESVKSISDAEKETALFSRDGGLRLVVTNLSAATLPTNYTKSSLSYFPITIKTSVYIPTEDDGWNDQYVD